MQRLRLYRCVLSTTEWECKSEHSIVSLCQTNCQWQVFDYSARIVLVILVVHHRFANQGWRISGKGGDEFRNSWYKGGDTLSRPQTLSCVCRRRDQDPICCLFAVGRSVFELCRKKNGGKRHCKHLCKLDLAVAKSNLGRENPAIRLRASNNSRVPGV